MFSGVATPLNMCRFFRNRHPATSPCVTAIPRHSGSAAVPAWLRAVDPGVGPGGAVVVRAVATVALLERHRPHADHVGGHRLRGRARNDGAGVAADRAVAEHGEANRAAEFG